MRTNNRLAGLGDAASDAYAASTLLDAAAQAATTFGADPSIANALQQGSDAAYSASAQLTSANYPAPMVAPASPISGTMVLGGLAVLAIGAFLLTKRG